jgi:alkylhydroperoxidase family enzyme
MGCFIRARCLNVSPLGEAWQNRERRAACNYCLSAHTYLGKNLAKLDDSEIATNRGGASNDPKADAAVRFAAKLVRERGHVSEDDLRVVKSAGYDDAQVIEIIFHVALNTWTNYLNEASKTDIDFPVITARRAA